MQVVKPSAELIAITPGAEKVIELAGRICYKSEDKITDISASKFIEMIISRGHESVLEHASASIKFVCDRGVTHELVRHRTGVGYSQESTRYCSYNKEKFGKQISVIQPSYDMSDEAKAAWYHSCIVSEQMYFLMLDSGCTPQLARSVLPTCLKTEIIVSANMREWRHIIRLRTSPAAHPQIKEIMLMALNLLSEECPAIFSDLKS